MHDVFASFSIFPISFCKSFTNEWSLGSTIRPFVVFVIVESISTTFPIIGPPLITIKSVKLVPPANSIAFLTLIPIGNFKVLVLFTAPVTVTYLSVTGFS